MTEFQPDDLDLKILRVLQKDGRKSFREVSKEVGATPATVINRVNKMQEQGVIVGYSANIDYDKLGYGSMAVIELSIKGGAGWNDLAEVADHPNVLSVLAVSGDIDVIITGKFKSNTELTSFMKEYLHTNNNIVGINTKFVMDKHKDSSLIEL